MLRVGRSHNFIAECEQTGPHGKLYGYDDQWNAASFGFNYAAEQVGGAQCPNTPRRGCNSPALSDRFRLSSTSAPTCSWERKVTGLDFAAATHDSQ